MAHIDTRPCPSVFPWQLRTVQGSEEAGERSEERHLPSQPMTPTRSARSLPCSESDANVILTDEPAICLQSDAVLVVVECWLLSPVTGEWGYGFTPNCASFANITASCIFASSIRRRTVAFMRPRVVVSSASMALRRSFSMVRRSSRLCLSATDKTVQRDTPCHKKSACRVITITPAA
jgi:hypothetical protein